LGPKALRAAHNVVKNIMRPDAMWEQPVEAILPGWNDAYERWKSDQPDDARDGCMTYLAGACYTLEALGYTVPTYDRVREEIKEPSGCPPLDLGGELV
jgi:hypothetical protein